jgi:lysyl-tRNA synthetase class 2
MAEIEFPFLPDHNPIIENRYRKADELRAQGIDPYPRTFSITHSCAAALQDAERLLQAEEKIRLAGRVLQIRSFGKSAFFHILDESGRIQVYAKKDQLGEDTYELFKKSIDTGDYVGVAGTLFRTKTGEITLVALELVLLTKAVRPLPEKWHGLRDTELRYRMRYVDLIVNPQVRETFRLRSRMTSTLRRLLDAEGFLEVETPMMQPLYGGALARPFITHHNALDMPLYLRIAPELYLKRLVVGGIERVYEINRNFRNEGISTQHNPEFTMLELYAALWNYADMMEFLERIISRLVNEVMGTYHVTYRGEEIDFTLPWPRITILDSVKEKTGGVFGWDMDEQAVRAEARRAGIDLPKDIHDPADLVLGVYEAQVEPTFVQPTFVMEFPKSKSPLAKSKPDAPHIAQRFELFVGRLEVANAYSELNDPREQFARFEDQARRRREGDMEAVGEVDSDYVRALEYGMPPAAGLGVGLDRLAMILTDSASIRDVILFPLMRMMLETEQARALQETEGGDEPAENSDEGKENR